ncbi:MAG: hypothetical protein GC159_18155 [Phycisphaera sp.]|nr:hypothetical protein [Phycisphaera sp.]
MERAPTFADSSPAASAINQTIAEAWERELTRFDLCGFGDDMSMKSNGVTILDSVGCGFDEIHKRMLEMMGEKVRMFGRSRQRSGAIRVWIEDIEVVVAVDIHPTQDRVEVTLYVPRDYAISHPI